MSGYNVLIGDCIESMRTTIPDRFFNTCVTSPPYFGLRDYGQDGQIGLEATPDEFVEALVAVFREVWRVLRDDGTVWLNLGDSYHGGGSTTMAGQNTRLYESRSTLQSRHSDGSCARRPKPRGYEGYRPKDLIGIPWRVAFALQADGWYLRQDIIWHKPNPMPESVRDRCTKSHEYIFLLSKSPKYYYDHEAMKEPAVGPGKKCGPKNDKSRTDSSTVGTVRGDGVSRNRRSVWTVPTRPYKGAHFATFPPDLIEPCILAGCPPGGLVLDPFGGSGTTAGVAVANGRSAVLCELSAEYAALIPARVESIVKSKGAARDLILEIKAEEEGE